MATTGCSLRDLNYVRLLFIQKRCFGRHIVWTPKLKEILHPPVAPTRPKHLPKLEDIKIPQRIDRQPTDILKALGSTVGRDYTAPHYKFHDDPYLIPYSNMSKRAYALSKESGRKAAKWVRQQHADLFEHRQAEPPVEAFYPTPVFTEESDVTESDLNNYILQGMPTEAVKIYNIMKAKNIDISNEGKQSLLELLCFTNEAEPIDEDLYEERWYKAAMPYRDRIKNTWKSAGIAESLFAELENPSPEAYCAMIRGHAKHFSSEKAWHLYTEVQSKGIGIDTETYNSLISISNYLRENAELRWVLIEELLLEMNQNKVAPNLGTLNAVLESVMMMGNPRQAKIIVLATLSEFKKLGIEPSLASYFYVLSTFCKDRGPTSTILADILKEIQGKEFTIQDPKDTYFFLNAMDVARNHLQNVNLAYKIDELLHTGNNYDLIGDSFKESVYYRHFLALRCGSEPFEDFMQYYSRIVPNIYTPEPGITEEILKTLEINVALDYLPQLWSDIVIFDQCHRDNILALVLHIMSAYFPTEVGESATISQPLKLVEDFTNISWQIFNIVEGQDKERLRQICWTGKMLGDVLTIQLKGEQFENACEVIVKLISPTAATDVVGVTSLDALKLFMDNAILVDNGPMCLACLQYMSECGFPETSDFAKEVHEKVKLDAVQRGKLSSIAGFDFTMPARHFSDTDKTDNVAAKRN